MRWLIAPLLAALSACSSGATKKDASRPVSAPTAAAVAGDESGQDRAAAAGRALIGKPAPAVILTTIDGARINLASVYGRRPVYLKFWATWCVPCREQMPAFEREYERYGRDMTIVAVNTGFTETGEAIRRYRREHGLRMPIVVDDGTLAAALNLRVTPQHVVISRDGRIAYVGHLDDQALHHALDTVISAPAALVPAGPARAVDPAGSAQTAAPAAVVKTLDGRTVRIGGASDKRHRALVFLSPWCETYLQKSRPQVAEACRRTRLAIDASTGRSPIEWLGIAAGLWASENDLKRYRDTNKVRIPLVLDEGGALFRAYGVHDVPMVILLDRRGRVVRRIVPSPKDLIRTLVRSG